MVCSLTQGCHLSSKPTFLLRFVAGRQLGLGKSFSLGENELGLCWVVFNLVHRVFLELLRTCQQTPKTTLEVASGEEFSVHKDNKCSPRCLKPTVRSHPVPNLRQERLFWAEEEEGEVRSS